MITQEVLSRFCYRDCLLFSNDSVYLVCLQNDNHKFG